MRPLYHPAREEIVLPGVLHALSDPLRLEIVCALAVKDEQPCGLVQAQVAKSTLSHHLKVLREAGLTHTRVDGTQRLLSLRFEDLEERFPGLLDCVLRSGQPAGAA